MKPVIVWIDDPSTTLLVETDGITYGKAHPVPEDDQLTRALDRQTRSAILYHRPSAEIAGHPGSVEALRDAKLIRAAFRLNEGE